MLHLIGDLHAIGHWPLACDWKGMKLAGLPPPWIRQWSKIMSRY